MRKLPVAMDELLDALEERSDFVVPHFNQRTGAVDIGSTPTSTNSRSSIATIRTGSRSRASSHTTRSAPCRIAAFEQSPIQIGDTRRRNWLRIEAGSSMSTALVEHSLLAGPPAGSR